MPIYEYTCQKCKAHVEVMQKVTDEPLKRHGKCGGKMVKEWSRTGFQFKGSGWYVTDYAAKKSDSSDTKEPGATGGKDKKTEDKKSDTATAAEAAPKSGATKPDASKKNSSSSTSRKGASDGD